VRHPRVSVHSSVDNEKLGKARTTNIDEVASVVTEVQAIFEVY
jgi:hypothetical protein